MKTTYYHALVPDTRGSYKELVTAKIGNILHITDLHTKATTTQRGVLPSNSEELEYSQYEAYLDLHRVV